MGPGRIEIGGNLGCVLIGIVLILVGGGLLIVDRIWPIVVK